MLSKIFKTKGQIEITFDDKFHLTSAVFNVWFGKKQLVYRLALEQKIIKRLKARYYRNNDINISQYVSYDFVKDDITYQVNPWISILYYLSGASKLFNKNVLHFQCLAESGIIGKKGILSYIDAYNNLAIESDIDNKIIITF
jgi:hypothetical protein